MTHFCVQDLREVLAAELHLGSPPPLDAQWTPVDSVVDDLSDVGPGAVFVCDPEHPWQAEAAYAAGALGVISGTRHVEPWAGRFSLRTRRDTDVVLRLAAGCRDRSAAVRVAVTGVHGKSTCGRLLQTVLGTPAHAWQDALTHTVTHLCHSFLASGECEYQLGEISWENDDYLAISALYRAEVTVITSTRRTDGDMNVSVTIGERLQALPDSSWVVINGDDPQLAALASETPARVVRVGRGADCDVRAEHVSCQYQRLTFVVDGQPYSLPLPCRSYLHLALAAIAVARLRGIASREIAARMAGFAGLPGCCALSREGEYILIDDHRASSPQSMRASLEMLGEVEDAQRRIVVCGERLADEAAARQLADAIVAHCGADTLIAYGPHAATLVRAAKQAGLPDHAAVHCPSSAEAHGELAKRLRAGDAVLVTGTADDQIANVITARQTAETVRRDMNLVPVAPAPTESPAGHLIH